MQTTSSAHRLQVLSILLLVLFSPLAIDVYLPAFPDMAAAFAVDKLVIQDTMTWFMFSLGLGQLFAGPLADRYGCKPIALGGILIYLICAAGISVAQELNALLAYRVLQGLGACACSVAGFASVRDYFGPHKSGQMISYINALICFGTATAPILGSWITLAFGWQGNFHFMFIFGLVAGVIVLKGFQETKPVDSYAHQAQPAKPLFNLSQYLVILKERVFVYHIMLCMLSMTVILAYVSSAPTWLMMELGLTKAQFAIWFASNACINILACLYTSRIIKIIGTKRTIIAGIIGLSVSGVLMLLLSDIRAAWAFMLPSFIASIAYALVLASAATKALAPFTHNAGTAAALLGVFQMSGSGLIVIIILLRFNFETPILLSLVCFLSLPSLFIIKNKSANHWYIQNK